MDRKSWQEYWGFTDKEMETIAKILSMTNGKIIAIKDNPERKMLCPTAKTA